MSGVPTPGTPERREYDAGRAMADAALVATAIFPERFALAALALYRDLPDDLLAARLRGVVDALAGVERVEVVGLVGDRDGRPHLLIDTSP